MKIDTNSVPLGKCIICERDVYSMDTKSILAIDKPVRTNLWTHRSCYNAHSRDEIIEILKERLEKYLEDEQEIGTNGKAKFEKIARKKRPTDEVPPKSSIIVYYNTVYAIELLKKLQQRF